MLHKTPSEVLTNCQSGLNSFNADKVKARGRAVGVMMWQELPGELVYWFFARASGLSLEKASESLLVPPVQREDGGVEEIFKQTEDDSNSEIAHIGAALENNKPVVILNSNGGHWVVQALLPQPAGNVELEVLHLYRNSMTGYELGKKTAQALKTALRKQDINLEEVHDLSMWQQAGNNCGTATLINGVSFALYHHHMAIKGGKCNLELFDDYDIAFAQSHMETTNHYEIRMNTLIESFLADLDNEIVKSKEYTSGHIALQDELRQVTHEAVKESILGPEPETLLNYNIDLNPVLQNAKEYLKLHPDKKKLEGPDFLIKKYPEIELAIKALSEDKEYLKANKIKKEKCTPEELWRQCLNIVFNRACRILDYQWTRDFVKEIKESPEGELSADVKKKYLDIITKLCREKELNEEELPQKILDNLILGTKALSKELPALYAKKGTNLEIVREINNIVKHVEFLPPPTWWTEERKEHAVHIVWTHKHELLAQLRELERKLKESNYEAAHFEVLNKAITRLARAIRYTPRMMETFAKAAEDMKAAKELCQQLEDLCVPTNYTELEGQLQKEQKELEEKKNKLEVLAKEVQALKGQLNELSPEAYKEEIEKQIHLKEQEHKSAEDEYNKKTTDIDGLLRNLKYKKKEEQIADFQSLEGKFYKNLWGGRYTEYDCDNCRMFNDDHYVYAKSKFKPGDYTRASKTRGSNNYALSQNIYAGLNYEHHDKAQAAFAKIPTEKEKAISDFIEQCNLGWYDLHGYQLGTAALFTTSSLITGSISVIIVQQLVSTQALGLDASIDLFITNWRILIEGGPSMTTVISAVGPIVLAVAIGACFTTLLYYNEIVGPQPVIKFIHSMQYELENQRSR